MFTKAKWICAPAVPKDISPIFMKSFTVPSDLKSAVLTITASGVYEASLNGHRVGRFYLAPGWTVYQKRLQYQTYDVTDQLVPGKENDLHVIAAKGWFHSVMATSANVESFIELRRNPIGILAELVMTRKDGSQVIIASDDSFTASESTILFSEIYDGQICDASRESLPSSPVSTFELKGPELIPQQGEEIHETDVIGVSRIFTTPKGETVIDFGQEVTGYLEIALNAHKGDRVQFTFGEVLDKDGNFYYTNYRSAKAQYIYTCKEGYQTYKPSLTFYGFRYARIDAFPGEPKKENFKAIVLCSAMKRTGYLHSSHAVLNQLFDNIIWGQKGNFVDVPTDCPQRNERLGWTGDAEVFIRTACLNFDTEKFYTKWLDDMMLNQREDGRIPHVVPNTFNDHESSAAWGDAAVVCPWELYRAFGNRELLAHHYPMMRKYIEYIGTHSTKPYLWTGAEHFGDWLGLDAPGYRLDFEGENTRGEGDSYKGASREDLIASACYAHCTQLTILAGRELGENTADLEDLYAHIVEAFRKEFPEYLTQTECVVAIHFGLAQDLQKTADQLAQMVRKVGVQLRTGFVGTPYILWTLSDYGYNDLAYELLLRPDFPGWLYPISKGATTMWEHWDGIKPDGSFWSDDMNSYNHYAYGAVADWVYQKALGITPLESGYQRIRIAPNPSTLLDELSGSLETRHGKVSVRWRHEGSGVRYEISTPVETELVIGDETRIVPAGNYRIYQ